MLYACSYAGFQKLFPTTTDANATELKHILPAADHYAHYHSVG